MHGFGGSKKAKKCIDGQQGIATSILNQIIDQAPSMRIRLSTVGFGRVVPPAAPCKSRRDRKVSIDGRPASRGRCSITWSRCPAHARRPACWAQLPVPVDSLMSGRFARNLLRHASAPLLCPNDVKSDAISSSMKVESFYPRTPPPRAGKEGQL